MFPMPLERFLDAATFEARKAVRLNRRSHRHGWLYLVGDSLDHRGWRAKLGQRIVDQDDQPRDIVGRNAVILHRRGDDRGGEFK